MVAAIVTCPSWAPEVALIVMNGLQVMALAWLGQQRRNDRRRRRQKPNRSAG